MFGQAALSLAFDGEHGVPRRAGVCTPATALGEVLVDRLREHGFTFDVDEVTAGLTDVALPPKKCLTVAPASAAYCQTCLWRMNGSVT